MEIFMRNLNFSFNHTAITRQLADALHSSDFPNHSNFNFHVFLHRSKRFRALHGGTGCLTLPTDDIGTRFLGLYGEGGTRRVVLDSKQVIFAKSNKGGPRNDVVQAIRLMPYRDPAIVDEEQRRSEDLAKHRIPLAALQFGWECRDETISIESEVTAHTGFQNGMLCFDEERRQFRIKFTYVHDGQEYFTAFRVSSIDSLTKHRYLGIPVAIFFLYDPPTYETGQPSSEPLVDMFSEMNLDLRPNKVVRRQLSYLPIPDHERVAPFASLVVRVEFQSSEGIRQLEELQNLANYNRKQDYQCRVERRGLFSLGALEEFNEWTRKLNWVVAYQVEAILRNRSADTKELLDILPDIKRLVKRKGPQFVAAFLKDFKSKVNALYRSDIDEDKVTNAVRTSFETALQELTEAPSPLLSVEPTDGSLYMSLHVTMTPTHISLDGPFPERSNRVIRQYDPQHQESFLRVTFCDEGFLQYRTDNRELDQRDFIARRFGDTMLNGLTIAGRKFYFLAYSQSALKEHSVWFVKPFVDGSHGHVDAESIIQSLGNFDDLQFDSKLMYCPARYAARLSQAFTATDACVIHVEEIIPIPDIEVTNNGHKYCFTDGVGTLSREVAREIWKHLKRTKRRARSFKGYPEAYQVRIMGSKGMLSVDHRLKGNIICLRNSMIKFDAPNSTSIEIARSFDRPTPYFLNRPLITLMEGLGVPFETFEHFQTLAVRETSKSASSLEDAAHMLEVHGLGSSFRLPSVFLSLHKLGITHLNGDPFYRKAMEFAINHVLRLLKHHARIPIPGAWTLVGVADIHEYLQPGQIYAFVKPLNGRGDMQLAHAIGEPPTNSPYGKQRLANTVVFSCKGDRPLPTCLGGGDLDGDIYNVIPLSDESLAGFRLNQDKFCEPSQYAPAPRKLLDRKSTMTDVAEFVMEYISSDVLGIIAINWLIIADQSPEGIQDADCITLANLHSDAVDYPKSGNPVALDKIPKLKHKLKPDWNAPETVVTKALETKYYQSSKAIGKLFRAIDLPAEHHNITQGATKVQTQSRRRKALQHSQESEVMLGLDPYFTTVERRVKEFIATEERFSDALKRDAEAIFVRYTSELESICYQHTLSSARNASLTEEEALIGTIVQKTSQPRQRKDKMAKLREATDILVRGIREALEGAENDAAEDYLERAWFAWELSLDKAGQFGGQSFGWVSLGAVFDAIRQIEERNEKERLGL